jgi:hypothetical protein
MLRLPRARSLRDSRRGLTGRNCAWLGTLTDKPRSFIYECENGTTWTRAGCSEPNCCLCWSLIFFFFLSNFASSPTL